MVIDVMGEQCSTEEMLTYMYHNKEFSGRIIVFGLLHAYKDAALYRIPL